MAIGVPSLDKDHKEILDIVNAFEAASIAHDFTTVGKTVDSLLRYVADHFRREESFMAQAGYPDCESHRRVHRGLSRRVQSLAESTSAAKNDVDRQRCIADLSQFLKDWLIEHFLKEDLKLRPYAGQASAPLQDGTAPLPPPPPIRVDMAAPASGGWERNRDIEYVLPDQFAHLMERLEYVIPAMPPPASGFTSFEPLCEAAIHRRIDKVLIFFQRHNPAVSRELPPFFLASPEFSEKFRAAVKRFILPTILGNRHVTQLSTNHNWSEVDAENFWDQLSRNLRQTILNYWSTGWDEMKLHPVKKPDGTSVLQIKENTKILRDMLAPSTETAYDLPKVGNREIAVFISLLDTQVDWWKDLNRAWQICHDLYEQEKDPRIFQSKAREGALRDNLLKAFGQFPESWCDFLVLACHRVFPRVSSLFLESFVASIGSNEQMREAYLPYTMRYLRQTRLNPAFRERERREEVAWTTEMKQLGDYLAGRKEKGSN